MQAARLDEILDKLRAARVLVVGDFFLDKYLVIDPRLSEVSLETGLEARQIVDARVSPGAAGTVVTNLLSLGVQSVEALGIIGCDGNGFELLRALRKRGAGTGFTIDSAERHTPTYTKPMQLLDNGAEREMERLDAKNRTPTPAPLVEAVTCNLRAAVKQVDAVVIADQVQEEDCGVITAGVREAIREVALQQRGKIFFADSRARIGKFQNVMIKPNEKEAVEAAGHGARDEQELLRRLYEHSRRPVFLTRGAKGISVFDGTEHRQFPALPVSGPIDPVGAGDSATAGIVAALVAGAGCWEAAEMGNLAASVTIRKLGTTGTASPEEIRRAFHSTWRRDVEVE